MQGGWVPGLTCVQCVRAYIIQPCLLLLLLVDPPSTIPIHHPSSNLLHQHLLSLRFPPLLSPYSSTTKRPSKKKFQNTNNDEHDNNSNEHREMLLLLLLTYHHYCDYDYDYYPPPTIRDHGQPKAGRPTPPHAIQDRTPHPPVQSKSVRQRRGRPSRQRGRRPSLGPPCIHPPTQPAAIRSTT
ncbi:hypothetical protein IWZ01DRAFT_353290 [Phyllosticta capitalensis]